jgi:hypothetical protein
MPPRTRFRSSSCLPSQSQVEQAAPTHRVMLWPMPCGQIHFMPSIALAGLVSRSIQGARGLPPIEGRQVNAAAISA